MKSPIRSKRLETIDFLRGVVMIVMALDHVRMFFGLGTWYAEPTNLATTTPLLFFTRWITHFCAPTFVFLAGTSAFLYGSKRDSIRETARFLLSRGLWLIAVEVIVINLAWTFDLTYSFLILQVIWAIGWGMIVLSALVFLPTSLVLAAGLLVIFGHNLLDPISVQGSSAQDLVWYALHQPTLIRIGSDRLINFVYPVLPWTGLMAIGYVAGTLYRPGVAVERRRRWLFILGLGMTLLFLVLRTLNLYGEPHDWHPQGSAVFTLMSFLNTTKYPPSLQFLLMTTGPALMLLAAIETRTNRLPKPVITLGRVPFFFYGVHLYLIHALAVLFLVYEGRPASEYLLSASGVRSGRLSDFGVGPGGVYVIWVFVVLLLYPLCRWYQRYRESHPSHWWLRYL